MVSSEDTGAEGSFLQVTEKYRRASRMERQEVDLISQPGSLDLTPNVRESHEKMFLKVTPHSELYGHPQ